MAGTYSHIEKEIVSHYQSLGASVTVDPPGRGAPDILGSWGDGSALVGEIKSATEASGSASSWWSYWTKPERDLRPHYKREPPTTPTALRGWCAVIDGQLREYCDRQNVKKGDLVVESGTLHRNDINQALAYLKSERRIKSFSNNADGILDYWTIEFI